MLKIIRNIILLFLLTIATISCSNVDNSNTTITFIDEEGEKTLEKIPTNVALLYPSYADIWLKSGGDIKIGVEDIVNRGFKDEVIIVGNGTGKDINLESLVGSNPDFVILSIDFPNHLTIANRLKEFNIKYGIFKLDTFNDFKNLLNQFSIINNTVNEMNTISKNIEDKIQSSINNRSNKEKEKVLLLRATSTKIKALNKDNFVGGILNDLNCLNISDIEGSLTADLSKEKILEYNPSYIFVVPMGDEEVAFNLAKNELENEIYSNVEAIKNNKIYYLEKDLFHYKPNLKWGEAYEKLETILNN